MDNNKYLTEVSRVLRSKGFEVAPFLEDNLPVLFSGEVACRVGSGGTLFLWPEDLHTDEANELYHKVAPFLQMVSEYMNEMEKAPVLKASGLDERFKLLADFGGAVLAGREMEKGAGMQFVTWLWDYQHTGVTLGHYLGDGYQDAKKDFALRSGLVPREKQFTPEQLTALYLCTSDALNYGLDISYEQDQLIRSAQSLIEETVPDLQQRIAAQQEQGQQYEQTM